MIHDIAIHLTGSQEDAVRIAHAAALARLLDAHLTGLQVHRMPGPLAAVDPGGAAWLEQAIAQSLVEAETITERLRASLAATGLNHELRRLDLFAGQAGEALAREVRGSDMFLGSRPYGDPMREDWVEEAVLFKSGRPCLFVPPGQASASYGRIFIAWNNSREVARAVAEAIPLLVRATDVVVGIVEEDASEAHGLRAGSDIGRYLSRHGVSADIRLINGWSDTGAALLNEAHQTGSDLVVMGAYGHSRMREMLLGGATRHMLTLAELPVFVAH